ncbi:MAG: glycosyltransferase family 4 protein [Syntrophales bacterium]|jgi:UDP-glucose:(heptosyl)LPS alpha-1,3-glucosyltransferase
MSDVRKIAIAIPKYGLVGGAEYFVAELTKRIALNPRYDIHVFANRWIPNSSNVTFHKVPIISFPKFLTTISFAYFANNKMAKLGFDLIHAHDRIFDADMYTLHGIPHGYWIREVRKKRMSINDHATEWTEKALVKNRRCRRFVSVSHLAQEILRQTYPMDGEKLQVIYPGIDAEKFQSLDRKQCRGEIRSRLGIGEEDVVILFVSMNFDIKGLDALMRAVAKAKLNWPGEKIKLLIVGKGDEKKYKRLAMSLGIGNDVIFAGVQKEFLERIYLASDIFSILSKFDTFGITVLEAMAASLPVIVSGNVGAKDLVQQGINGFVIKERADSEMAGEKIGILLTKEVRMRMGEAACRTAMNNSWDAAAKHYEDIYDKLPRFVS